MDLIRSLTCISASHLRAVRDDDSHVDRLSHRYTVAICVLFAIIVTTKQYAGDPIGKLIKFFSFKKINYFLKFIFKILGLKY